MSTILTDCHNVEDYRDMMATEELYEVNVGDFTVRVRLDAVNRLYLRVSCTYTTRPEARVDCTSE